MAKKKKSKKREKKKSIIKKIKKKVKIKEIKNFGEIKEIHDESNLREVIKRNEEVLDENRLLEFLQANAGSPVLERVADASDLENLEQSIAHVQVPDSREKEDTGTDYLSIKSDYLSIDSDNSNSPENTYTESPTDYSALMIQNEEAEETRRLTGRGDISQNRGNGFEREKQSFIESDKETRKYVSKGESK
jgi:hypothetical protein